MELRMLSGLHRGAALGVEEGVMTLGASTDADVLVADPGVAPVHARLRRNGPSVVLTPAGGEVRDSQGRLVEGPADISPGSVYRLGEVWIGFFSENDPWLDTPEGVVASTPAAADAPRGSRLARIWAHFTPPQKRALRLCMWAFAILGILGMLAAFTTVLREQNGSKRERKAASAAMRAKDKPQLPETEVPADSAPPAPAALPPAELERVFRRQLADRELIDKVELDLGARAWIVRGSLDADDQAMLDRMVRTFGQKFGTAVPIEVSIVPLADLLPFRVVQVTSGKTANVVIDSGERLFVGDTVKGYRLQSVEPNRVVFAGRRRIDLAW
jgi:type III secretion protein D